MRGKFNRTVRARQMHRMSKHRASLEGHRVEWSGREDEAEDKRLVEQDGGGGVYQRQ